MRHALITGASRGFGRTLALALLEQGWVVIATARTQVDLEQLQREAGEHADRLVLAAGSVTEATHRARLADLVARIGGELDLLVNNAGALGPSPQPELVAYPLDVLGEVLATNVVAPLGLVQTLLDPLERAGGAVVQLSSDAAVEAYEGWGGYGASKAALDQLSAVLAVERPALSMYAFDPGDMRTDMHQSAFPGEDISDRPLPESVVPALLRLLETRPASGRYRAASVESWATRAVEVAR